MRCRHQTVTTHPSHPLAHATFQAVGTAPPQLADGPASNDGLPRALETAVMTVLLCDYSADSSNGDTAKLATDGVPSSGAAS